MPVVATVIVVPLLILAAVIGLIVCLKLKSRVILKDDYEAMSQPGRGKSDIVYLKVRYSLHRR